MFLVGLTGGIGSGKSTVAALLARRGAAVIDADVVARSVVEPGGPAYDAVVERFGPGVVAADGALDRAALAAVVFADPAALADLNRITHPAITQRIGEQVAAHAGERVVVIDLPLLDRSSRGRYPLDAVLVVDVPVDVAVQRLVGQRGSTEEDARARVAAQIPREERLALADHVIDNSSDRAALEAAVDRAWAWVDSRASEARGVGGTPR